MRELRNEDEEELEMTIVVWSRKKKEISLVINPDFGITAIQCFVAQVLVESEASGKAS